MRKALHAGSPHRGRGSGLVGSCYLNNAAIAAQALRSRRAAGSGHRHRRAPRQRHPDDLLRARRCLVRLAARGPGGGLAPALRRVRRRVRSGPGAGGNRNLPLAPGAGDDEWLAALDLLCAEASTVAADAVVVSLGLDAAAADPESPLRVTEAGYFAAGLRIAALGPA